MFHLHRSRLSSKEVGDRVVEARQLYLHPSSQEDDVTHQRLVLKCRSEGACIALLSARIGCLQSQIVFQRILKESF